VLVVENIKVKKKGEILTEFFFVKKCSKNQSLFMSIRKSSLNTGKKHNGGNNNE